MITNFKISMLFITTLSLSSIAQAADNDIDISGFMTVGLSVTDNEANYLVQRYSDDKSFSSESLFGLQIDTRLNEKVRLSSQLVAQAVNDFKVEAEWLYINYQISPALTARAGRLRLPLYATSSYVHVNSAYTWIAPPGEVYGQTPFTRYHGADFLYRFSSGNTNYSAKVFGGGAKDKIVAFGVLSDIELKSTYGSRITAENDFFKAHIAYMHTKAIIDIEVVVLELEADFFTAGLTLSYGEWESIFEWARTDSDSSSLGVVDGAYFTQSRAFGDWAPYITYGVMKTDEVDDIRKKDSYSASIGVRYDDEYNLTWKGELHHGKGDDGKRGQFGSAPVDSSVNLLRLTVSTTF